MAVIKVPKTPKRAFNPDRPPSGLLRAQVEHLEAAAQRVQGALRHRKVRTEGQAALYIQQLTAQLYPHDVPVPEPDGGSPLAAPRRSVAGPARRAAAPKPRKATRKAKAPARRTAARKATKAAPKKKGAKKGATARAGKRKVR